VKILKYVYRVRVSERRTIHSNADATPI